MSATTGQARKRIMKNLLPNDVGKCAAVAGLSEAGSAEKGSIQTYFTNPIDAAVWHDCRAHDVAGLSEAGRLTVATALVLLSTE